MATLRDGEKRWTSMLSMDLVGFTPLTQSLGEERAYELIQTVLKIAEREIEHCGGHVVDTAGDGILASFGAPTALENAPLQTCRAAVRIRAAIARAADKFETSYQTTPALRMGVAGGNVMIAKGTKNAIKIVGDAVNLAARLQAAAEPGTILITDAIYREVAGNVIASKVSVVSLKGFSELVRVRTLDTLVDSETRFDGLRKRGLHRFVSREDELSKAHTALTQTDTSDSLLISGPAGIGKSRLLHEVLDRLPQDRPTLIGQCSNDANNRPFAPIEAMIRQVSTLPREASLADHLTAIQASNPTACDEAGIARFTSPRAQEKDPIDRILHDRDFLSILLAQLNDADGTIPVIEDLHWVDPATANLLQKLFEIGTPFIATTRDPNTVPLSDDITHIALAPLLDDCIADIIGGDDLPPLSPSLTAQLVHRAEGIPLIAEELARAVRASDHLIETDQGLNLAGTANELLSGNLQQLVLSRVDRLLPDQKNTLQIASAIGRDFSWPLLLQVLATDQVTPDLTHFDGIIGALDPQTGRFAHALIQEAIYNGLLTPQRQDIHRRIAAALEKDDHGHSNSVLADHYLRANNPPSAAQALIEAGREALQAYDLLQADDRLSKAFHFASDDPNLLDNARFADLCNLWMRTLSVNGNYRRILEYATRISDRLDKAPYSSETSVTRALIALAHTGERDYERARKILFDAIIKAEAENDTFGAAWAKSTLARVYDETGWEPADVTQRMCNEILPIAEAAEDRLLIMTALYLLTASYRSCGRRRDAIASSDAIEAIADEYGDRRARAYANWARGTIFTIGGDPEAAADAIKEARKNVLPHTTDSRVVNGVDIFTQIYTHPPEHVRNRLIKMRNRSDELLDYNLIHSADWMRGVLELRAGNLAVGWKMADAMIPAFTKGKNMNVLRQAHIMRAEVLLTIAGLIDPDAEAPPDRPKFKRQKPSLADVLTFAKLKFTAKKRAALELNEYIRLDPQQRGAHFARAKIGLGLIAAAHKDKAQAKLLLQEGLEHASTEGISVLCERAKNGLAAL